MKKKQCDKWICSNALVYDIKKAFCIYTDPLHKRIYLDKEVLPNTTTCAEYALLKGVNGELSRKKLRWYGKEHKVLKIKRK